MLQADSLLYENGGIIGLLSWFIIGLIIGIIAKFIMPGKYPGGLVITIILGIAGAFVGGLPVLESASALSAVLICAAW